jgi:nitroimidazol reductase NimA-like FMN-containing flavoprotein (pyridoxamine 5'-phosphate oxidase superfamily)
MTDGQLEELSLDECLSLLRTQKVGRLAVVVNEFPVILPVNYRIAETSGPTWVVVRTRPGNILERATMKSAFEIDGIDAAHQSGWSVVVRGMMHHINADVGDFKERFDPHSWLFEGRDAWLGIEPFEITGRRLHGPTPEWAFLPSAYL